MLTIFFAYIDEYKFEGSVASWWQFCRTKTRKLCDIQTVSDYIIIKIYCSVTVHFFGRHTRTNVLNDKRHVV